MKAKIIDGRKIADDIKKNVKKDILNLYNKYDIRPHIKSVIVGENKESELYLRLRDKACEKVGIKSTHLRLSEKISENELVKNIIELNEDESVNGILIQMPIPDHINQSKIFETLSPKKDVEGFTPENMGRLLSGDEFIVPCTPLAVLKILESEKTNLKGKDIVIINHSNVVGKPLSALLLNRNASVSVIHVFTKDLKSYTKNADILISAAGVKNLIKKDYVKKDSFLIDVGIIKTDTGVAGDIDFDKVKEISSKITPVPGGVGPVTVACSLINMKKIFQASLLENE